ncbi:MAG: DMT family transporter [Leptolyngbyaceae bacterium]|nr:DMT family transporter [Leptolyngbyaceae bacterium]
MNSSERQSRSLLGLSISDRLTHWLALAAALLGIACASILLVVAEREISPYAATFNRLGFATLIFISWNSSQTLWNQSSEASVDPDAIATKPGDQPFPQSILAKLTTVNRGNLLLFLTSGLAFSSSLTLWAWSLTQTSVANSTLLNNMMPIFTTIGAWLVFRQTFSRVFLLGMAIAITGAIIIGLEDLQVTQGFIGDAAALGAALLSAINILSVKQLRQHFETTTIMMWTSGIGSVALLTLLLVFHEPIFPSTSMGWMAVLGLAMLSQALGQGLLTYSLKQFSASLVAVSMLTIPVIAAVLALILFAEHLTLLNWGAFGIVLLGIYLAVSDQTNASVPKPTAARNAHSG